MPILIDLDRSVKVDGVVFDMKYGCSAMYSIGDSSNWTARNTDWRQLAIMITFIQSTNCEDYHNQSG